jgi:xanthosine utilization system XapX-like protein
MMNSAYREPGAKESGAGWIFWLKWVVGSTVAWIAVFMLTFLTIGMMVETFWGDPEMVLGEEAFAVALTAVFTLSFTASGGVQWLLLRRRFERIGGWVLASGVGGLLVGILYFALMGVVSETASEIIHNGLAGVVVGLLQWRILRRQVARAHLWIVAATVAFVMAGGGAAIISTLTGMDSGTSSIFGVLAMSALTGSTMVWLLRQPPRPEFVAPAS